MSLYLDSSALVALYFPEAASRLVARAVGTSPIPFSFLHELELKNGLSLKKFRREASDAEVRGTLRLVEEDRNAGRLFVPSLDWARVWQHACDLSLRYSGTLGTRSLDVLHVAIASAMNVSRFISLDERQCKMARQAGLVVPPLR